MAGNGTPQAERGPSRVSFVGLPWRDRLLVALVPAMVVAVAGLGTWRYHHLDQTSWRGGTLGMFATVDGSTNRLVRGILRDGQIVLVPGSISDEGERARVTPTDANLRRLADAWLNVENGSELERIEVLRTEFDPEGPSVRLGLVRSHLLDGDG